MRKVEFFRIYLEIFLTSVMLTLKTNEDQQTRNTIKDLTVVDVDKSINYLELLLDFLGSAEESDERMGRDSFIADKNE